MTASTTRVEDPSARHRLPYDIEPVHYDLRLAPDLDSATFAGKVTIAAQVRVSTERIQLHAQELEITNATVASSAPIGTTVSPGDQEDRIVLALDAPAGEGPITIELSFTGTLNDMLCGFYRSTFTDDQGAIRTIATTQFEATDARRAFPCFDEPDRKATFSISIDAPEGTEAFSNGPAVNVTVLDGGARRFEFAPTIKMSTYLVAYVVGPLVATEPVDVDGIAVRVVHVPGREQLTGFALEIAAHSLRFYADFFGLPYPGQKLDLLAIPDFAFGAMENLGCVTFRETALLVDRDNSSQIELERVADVVAHEIAHMWFGDLVTMKWWNGIWLNEAFATLMELMCVDSFRPEWQRWASFGMERDAAMATDALHATRPVEYPVGPPEEAQGMFDVLTYQKGAAVLRMLERYLGAETFRDGIRLYLSTHQLGNTDTPDLWSALAQSSNEPVEQIMDSWILQGGFPLVNAERLGSQLTLTQEPFAYSAANGSSAIGQGWRIPVTARACNGKVESAEQTVLLGDIPATVEVPEHAPVVVNAGGWGFYRVRYDTNGLQRLAPVLPTLATLERFNAVSDTWAAVVAGRMALADSLLLGESLRRDGDPDVWGQVIRPLQFVDHVVDEDGRQLLRRYVRALAGPAFAELGWNRRDGDTDRTATLRAELVGVLGGLGADEEVRRHCLDAHSAALAGTNRLEPDLANAVVRVVASAGGEAEFESFLARFRNPPTPQEEVRYLYALAGFEPAELSGRAFAIAVNEARTQNGPFLVQMLLANRSNGPANWRRLVGEWDHVTSRIPANIVPHMLQGAKLLCSDPELAESVRSFLGEHPLASAQRTVDQIVERLGVNVDLVARLRPGVAAELAAGIERLARA